MDPLPHRWVADPLRVRTWLGAGTYGPVYSDPVELLAVSDSNRRLVRNSLGDQVVSELLLRLRPRHKGVDAVWVDTVSLFTPESVVTFAGRTSTVITAKVFTLFGNPQYVEVTTT